MKKLADRIISVRAFEKVKSICLPLQKLGIHHFAHDITFGKGKVSIITNDLDVFLLYYQQGMPMLCSSDEGRLLEPGIYLNKVLMETYQDCAYLLSFLATHYNVKQSVHIVEKENDCQHLFSFGGTMSEIAFLHLVLNYLDQLKAFIQDYKYLARDIIQEAKKPSNQIILPALHERPENYFNLTQNLSSLIPHTITLPNTTYEYSAIPFNLAPQQKRCLQLLVKGHSAKEIAKIMQLSYRTVEHYIQRLRATFGCASTKELITKYYLGLLAQ